MAHVIPIVVEDGSIVAGANSYVTEEQLTDYADARGITLPASDEQLGHLIFKAMDYIESLQYKGMKVQFDQPLQWPRADVYVDGYYVNADTIPNELKNGLMQTAIAIHEGNDPLADVTQSAIRKKVGEIEIEYSAGSSQNTISRKIQSSLYKLLSGVNGSGQIKVGKA